VSTAVFVLGVFYSEHSHASYHVRELQCTRFMRRAQQLFTSNFSDRKRTGIYRETSSFFYTDITPLTEADNSWSVTAGAFLLPQAV